SANHLSRPQNLAVPAAKILRQLLTFVKIRIATLPCEFEHALATTNRMRKSSLGTSTKGRRRRSSIQSILLHFNSSLRESAVSAGVGPRAIQGSMKNCATIIPIPYAACCVGNVVYRNLVR